MAEAVKSAGRALALLELLTTREEPMSFADIGDALGYPRSSLHGLLHTLVARGWVRYDRTTQAYALGLRTLEAGHAYSRSQSLVERALPLMRTIRDAVDETVQLAVLDGLANVYIAKVDGRQALTLASEVGRRLPAHATGVGKVLLAGLDPTDLDRRLDRARLERAGLQRFTPHTITDPDRLLAHLDQIRHRGFGVDNEEYTRGVRCVAVPICDESRHAAAALSVSVPTVRFTTQHRECAHRQLAEVAAQLSATLGYRSGGAVA